MGWWCGIAAFMMKQNWRKEAKSACAKIIGSKQHCSRWRHATLSQLNTTSSQPSRIIPVRCRRSTETTLSGIIFQHTFNHVHSRIYIPSVAGFVTFSFPFAMSPAKHQNRSARAFSHHSLIATPTVMHSDPQSDVQATKPAPEKPHAPKTPARPAMPSGTVRARRVVSYRSRIIQTTSLHSPFHLLTSQHHHHARSILVIVRENFALKLLSSQLRLTLPS